MMDLVFDESRLSPKERGTFSSQDALPRVPLPALADTLARFDQWCAPLLSAEQLEQTRAAVATFEQPAQKLHAWLEAYDRQSGVHSWLDSFWPTRYLGRRVPIAINANFIFAFVDRPLNQVQRATQLIHRAVAYKLALDDERVPPSMIRDTALCMAQQKYLFSTTRIPGDPQDRARTPFSTNEPGSSKARHILVCHHDQLFSVDVIDANGNAYSTTKLELTLQEILSSSESKTTNEAVNYLTTLPRADWAGVRQQLLASNPQNHASMETIEQALFCLCLDAAEPQSLVEQADQLLRGDGGNRWYDKSISLIVFADGSAGINIEHSGLDGTTVVEFVDFLHDDAAADMPNTDINGQSAPSVTGVDFVLDDDLRTKTAQAAAAYRAAADDIATLCFSFDDFGTSHIKSLKISPDAFLQLAFQLAHYRTKGHIGTTYESIATRHFQRGRTEAMRVVTPEIVRFVELMQDTQANIDSKREALQAAAQQHIARVRQCQSGDAPEQHLWQLQMIAKQHGDEIGTGTHFELFDSPGWRVLRNDYLSTSSAPSANVTVFGFGATSKQCIGIGYLPRATRIEAFMSTPAASRSSMHDFADKLPEAFRDLAAVLEG